LKQKSITEHEMALHNVFQASVGLLCLGHVLIGVASVESQTCETIIPVNTTAKRGDSAVLKCRLSSQNIAWTFCSRDSGPHPIATNCVLVPSAVGKYRLEKTGNSCNLIVDNVTANHWGTYNCQDLTLNDDGHNVLLGNPNENLALHKNATYSSPYKEAHLAVDGIADGYYTQKSCASTDIVNPAWWAVDLGQETSIGRVRITNRVDCCPERLQQFHIGSTNVSPWVTPPNLINSTICTYYAGIPAGGIAVDIYCDPGKSASGRYLFIYMGRSSVLTICEVEAYYN